MRVLVTGGGGMIGSHLVDALLCRGDEVVVVDNFLTGRRENLAHLAGHPRLHVRKADICSPPGRFARLEPCERIYHLASPASPPDFARFPLETLKTNATGTWTALELARRWQARFLLASTSEIYGDPLEHPQRETYCGNVNSLGPRACYDEGKRFAESLASEFWRLYQVDVRIARLFNTYGPRSRPDDGRVVPNFCVQALTGKPLTIFGSGMQTRSLCYVADIVSGLVALMESAKAAGETVNLGSPEELSVLEIAHRITALTGNDAPVEMRPLPVDDPTRRCPDISKARALLGWEPATGLDEGLRVTLDYFRAELVRAQGAQPRRRKSRQAQAPLVASST